MQGIYLVILPKIGHGVRCVYTASVFTDCQTVITGGVNAHTGNDRRCLHGVRFYALTARNFWAARNFCPMYHSFRAQDENGSECQNPTPAGSTHTMPSFR